MALAPSEVGEEHDIMAAFVRRQIRSSSELLALVGERVFSDAAPQGTADTQGFDPFMIFAAIRVYPDTVKNGVRRVKSSFDVKVVFVVPVRQESQLIPALVELNDVLHRQTGTVTWEQSGRTFSGRVLGCHRLRTYRQPEEVNGDLLVQRGHVYHLEVQARGVTGSPGGTP